MVQWTAAAAAPAGWLVCDGSAVSRTAYSSLFGAIGTTYGAGDGVTTFNLPDLRGRAVVGAGQGAGLSNRALTGKGGEETHVLTTTEMPGHSHNPSAGQFVAFGATGSNLASPGGGTSMGGSAVSSSGGGGAHNNMQPWIALTPIIKV